MSATQRKVVIIGGGVVGAACAYYLRQAGWQVVIVERGKFGQGCSHGNCGFVCPSHVLPLAVPGAIRMALGSLLRPNSPFKIKPRLDPALWGWLLRFARRCNERDMLASGRAIQPLLTSSRQLYDELMRTEAFDCDWQTQGLLFVLKSSAAMEHFVHADELLRKEFNLGAERFDGPALNQLEPALLPGLAGGWLYRTDAHLRPDRLMASWQRILTAQGVEIREDTAFTDFARSDGRALSAVTSRGEWKADAFVVATGAWTPTLNRQLDLRVPIQPGKGYSITMRRPARCPSLPMVFEEHRVAVTPFTSGYRLGSTMEFAGYDTTLNPRRLDLLRDAARHYLHEPLGESVEEEWFGWRPMTYDSTPIIDRCPALPNVLLAAGHNMLGLSMSPATGKLAAELLSGQTPHLDIKPY
ncbi:MAG: FAD-dependent oxidoreductase, partial [Planctomycetia bacterium]|nr:FAD-dependent oxidoreductase [Planctomycetia bacterium]